MRTLETESLRARLLRSQEVEFHVVRLREDDRFRLEMAYCGPRGIPHGQFLAWEPDDQDKALAWVLLDRAVCPGCGTFPDEWVDPMTGRTVPDPPYVPELVRCYGCAEREAFTAEVRKGGGDLDGMRVRLRPFDPDRDDEED